jgi:uncharacterized repeat protein (TIGR03803 family)
MTNGGGANNVGVIFSFDMSSNTYTKLHDFDGTHGGNPFENLIQATDGKLYGLTYMGGYYNDGVLFSFNITTSTYTDLFEFTGVNTGANPTRSVMQASNGKLYGTAFSGGASNMGVAFSYDINYNAYTKLVDFNATIGSNPDCSFIETPQMTTGIPAITDNAVGVYPNPATSVLNITQSKFTTITITNVLGEEVYNQAINNSTPTAVDVSNWSKGVYLLQLKSETETLVKKVVVE